MNKPINGTSKKDKNVVRNRLSPLLEMESEFVEMGELIEDSEEKQKFKAQMTFDQ